MAEEARKTGLGRGMAALLGDLSTESPSPAQGKGYREVPIEQLRPNPNQPRRRFQDEDLKELASSIRERGVLQPIIVRPLKDERDAYQIVAGERRWRAAQLAQRHKVPIVVRDLSDAETLEIGLIENVQRSDLNAMEEAAGYQTLIDTFGYTQDQLGKLIGKSRSHVANMIRLMSLPQRIQVMLADGRLSTGHARALIGQDRAEEIAAEIVSKGLNVRQVEALLREDRPASKKSSASGSSRKGGTSASGDKDADTVALERSLTEKLGLSVSIEDTPGKGGEIRIAYKTLEQLDDVVQLLLRPSGPKSLN